MLKPSCLFVLFALCLPVLSCQVSETKTQESTEPVHPTSPSGKVDSWIYAEAPNAITRNIIQDRAGNIWFATFNGAIKFDGKEYTNMTLGIIDHRFFSVLEDQKGHIWFGTIGGGVYQFDGQTFKNFTTEDGLVDNQVTNIYEDRSGKLWFGTLAGISVYENGHFKNYHIEYGKLNDDVNTIIEDEEGTFWIGTRSYAFQYDGTSFTKLRNHEGEGYGNVRHIIKDRSGNMWWGGNDGLWRYDGKRFKQFTSDFVGYLYEDRAGNIWTSSHSSKSHWWALSRYDVHTLEEEEPTVTEVITEERMFFGILEDQEGFIWAGCLDGVYRYKE